MAPCVHALHESVVIALLHPEGGGVSRPGSRDSPHRQTGTGTHARTALSTDGRARHCAHYRAKRRAPGNAVAGDLIRGGATDLRAGVLPAVKIVGTKPIEALAGARQRQAAGAAWNGRARA